MTHALAAGFHFLFYFVLIMASSGAIDFVVKWAKCVYEIIRINQKYTWFPALIVIIQSILSSYIDTALLYLKDLITEVDHVRIAYTVHVISYCVACFIIVKYSAHKYKMRMLFVYIGGNVYIVYNVGVLLEACLTNQAFDIRYGALTHAIVFTLLVMYIFWGNPLDCIRKHLDFGSSSSGGGNSIY